MKTAEPLLKARYFPPEALEESETECDPDKVAVSASRTADVAAPTGSLVEVVVGVVVVVVVVVVVAVVVGLAVVVFVVVVVVAEDAVVVVSGVTVPPEKLYAFYHNTVKLEPAPACVNLNRVASAQSRCECMCSP